MKSVRGTAPMSSLRTFFIHYSHFLTGSALSLLLGLISFPILTRLLTREEYGVMGLVTTTMFFAVALAKAGLSDGIIRFYKEYDSTTEMRSLFASTVLVRGLIFAFVTTALYLVTIPLTQHFLNLNARYLSCFLVMGVYLMVRPLNIIVLNVLRATGETIFFNLLGFISKGFSIAISLVLLIYVIKDLYGYFIGVALTETVVACVLYYWFLKNHEVAWSRVSGSLAVNLIKFGLPLLITETSYLILTYADRYMIAAIRGGDSLGLYTAGYNIASYISDMLMFSLSYAVVPIYVALYAEKGRSETEAFLRSCLHYLVIFLIPVCVGYAAVSTDLLTFLASKKYLEAGTFSPIILIASLCLGANKIFNAGLYLTKKTTVLLYIMLAAVAVNIVANFLLIPKYDVMGAAIATLIACVLTTVLTILFSYKYLVVRIDVRPVAYHLLLSGVMFVVVSHIVLPELWMSLAAKISVGASIIAIGALVIDKDLREKVWNLRPFRKGRG